MTILLTFYRYLRRQPAQVICRRPGREKDHLNRKGPPILGPGGAEVGELHEWPSQRVEERTGKQAAGP